MPLLVGDRVAVLVLRNFAGELVWLKGALVLDRHGRGLEGH